MTTYSAVVTTGIYCRPGCAARPSAENVRTFDVPAAAEVAGFRACLRCRPYRETAALGSDAPELVCRAVQMIVDGALDEGAEADLAARIGLSARHLRRLFQRHLGASPDQIARSRRAHLARRLLDDTDLTVIEIAFACGYGSLRQFNRAMRQVFRAAPTDLRSRRRRADRLVADGGLALRLPAPPGYDWDAVRAFLAARAVPGVESVADRTYRRTIVVGGAPGLLEVASGDGRCVVLRAHLPYWEGLIHVVERVGQQLGVEADPTPGAAALADDPVIGRLVRARPGLPVPGTWSAFEAGVRAILARDHALRSLPAIVEALGTPVPGLPGGLTHTFPDPERLTPAGLSAIGVPARTAAALAAFAATCGEGHDALRAGTNVDALAALPGVDEDLAHHLALRLGQRDVFPLADPSLETALADLGVHSSRVASWYPWLALAATHLMAHGDALATPRAVTNVTVH